MPNINRSFYFKNYKCELLGELRVRAAYEQRANYARAAYANSYEQRANYERELTRELRGAPLCLFKRKL